MSTLALFGASGATGTVIAQALDAAGISYRVVGRSRAALEKTFGASPLAEIVTWNPDDPASVRAAAADVDTIVYLVGVPYNHFELHPVVMRATLDGAIAAGVKRMLLLGTVYVYGRPQTPLVDESHPRNPHTFKGRMRKAQEDLLFEADAAGRIKGTVLRVPDFFGPNVTNSLVYDIFLAAKNNRRANVIGPIDTPHQYVYVPDLSPVAVALAREDRAYGRAWNFAGPGTITQREFARLVFEQAGHEPKLTVANKTMLRVLGLFNPLMRELVEMNYLQSDPVNLDDRALHELLPDLRATPYPEAIAQTLSAMA